MPPNICQWPCIIWAGCTPAQVTESLGVPRVYIKLLVELEDFLNKSLADKVGRRVRSPCFAAYRLFNEC